MEPGPGLSQTEIAALFQEAADPAVAFLYDDKVRDTLVAQVCDWSGCKPVWARLGLWAAQQAASSMAAGGLQWLGSQLGGSVAALLLRCPGCDRLAAGLRRLFLKAREEAAFRAEIDAIARGEGRPDPARLPADTPDDVKLALRLITEVRAAGADVSGLAATLDDLVMYLPGEFDALHVEIAALRDLIERPDAGPVAQPLPRAPALVGRDAALTALVGLLGHATDPNPILLRGGPGVGKSALTLAAVHHAKVAAHYPRRLFVRLVAVHAGAGIVDAVADALGLAAGADRAGRTFSALAEAATLLVLDNLETPWSHASAGTAATLGRLATVPGLRLLASLRGAATPAGVDWCVADEVRALGDDAARALFLATAPAAGADPTLDRLLAVLGGVPLAVLLLARRYRDGDGDAAGLLTQWRLRRTEVARHGTKGDPEDDLAAAIELSVQSPRLDGNAGRRLFALMGRLPDGIAADDRAGLLGADAFDGTAALKATGLAFADERDATRLRMLPPVLAHAAGQRPPADEEARLVAHYLALAAALPQTHETTSDPAGERRARLELRNLEDLLDRLLGEDALARPDQAGRLRELAVTSAKIADNRLRLGGVALAAAGYVRTHTALRRLATADPDNAQAQRDLSVIWNKLGDVRVAQGDLAAALAAFMAGKEIRDRLATADPGNAQAQRDLSVSWTKLGEVRVAQGDLAGALAAFTAGKEIHDRLATADPGNAQAQRDLSVSWERLGEVRVAQGDLAGALAAFTAGKEIHDRLATADPGNAQAQRDLSVSWEKLGDVRVARGDLAAALAAFMAGKEIRDRLATADPGDARAQRDLSISWNKLGDVRVVQGDLAGALAAFTADKEIADRLATADPGNAEWQRDLSVSWERIGDVRVAQGDLAAALAAFTAGKEICDRLATADPGDAQAQRDLSVSWTKLGDVRVARGDLAGALAAFTAGKEIADRLATADPGNARAQRDLSISWNKLGDVQVAQGDLAGALAAFTAGKEIRDRLATADPGNAQAQRDLSVSWGKLGDVRVAQGDLAGALTAFTAGKEIHDRLATADPGNAQAQRDLIVSYVKLAQTAAASPQRRAASTYYRQALKVARDLASSGRLAPTDAWMTEELERLLAAACAAPDAPP